jgi:hypothetical protein
MYTKEEFGKELEQELTNEFNVIQLARWAFDKYLKHIETEDDLNEIIMQIVVMEEGPEFEYTKEEFLKIAKDLQN